MFIRDFSEQKPEYIPGLDRWTEYKGLWIKYWDEFQEIYPRIFEKIFGPINDRKKSEVAKLIGCGNLKNGFTIHICPDCDTRLIVPFSCKSRLCLSCYRKKLFGWSINLANILNTELRHTHITFTMPGRLANLLQKRDYQPDKMVKIAARLYQREMRKRAGVIDEKWSCGIMATLHKSGNGLNYNPHVHMVATRDVINTQSGDKIDVPFLPYKSMRLKWMKTLLRHLVITKIVTKDEADKLIKRFKDGFHLHFQPIEGSNENKIYRTAEYLASGFFHNSQIVAVNHEKKEIIFKYRSWMDRKSREKSYKTVRMSVFEFMAKMLYFLPDHHQKNIKYYGFYSKGIKTKLRENKRASWASAIRHCFEKDPAKCPKCGHAMHPFLVYSHQSLHIYLEIKHA